MRKKATRSAIFMDCIPHYRLAVLRELHQRSDVEVTVHAPCDSNIDFIETQHTNQDFSHVPIRSYTWKIPFSRKGIWIMFQPYPILALLKRRFDVYMLRSYPYDLSLWICLLLGRLLNQRVCIWGQCISKRDSRLANGIFRIMIRLASAVAFYTKGDRDSWSKRGIPDEKLFVAYNALDTKASADILRTLSQQRLEEFQQRQGLVGKKVLIYTGRLVPYKRPEVLIEALSRLRHTTQDAHAVIVGDGPVREDLQRLAETLGVSESVTFTGPLFDEETLAYYFLSSHVAVMPGHAGLAIQHAFAYGVPIIIGRYQDKHPPEAALVIDGETGIRCRGDSAEEFVAAIETLLSNDALREKMSRNAQGVIQDMYNVERMADGLEQTLRYCDR
jgi:glycosyltransferase involved in cell wall biosynthesis